MAKFKTKRLPPLPEIKKAPKKLFTTYNKLYLACADAYIAFDKLRGEIFDVNSYGKMSRADTEALDDYLSVVHDYHLSGDHLLDQALEPFDHAMAALEPVFDMQAKYD